MDERQQRNYDWWTKPLQEYENFRSSGMDGLVVDISDIDDIIEFESDMLFNAMADVQTHYSQGFCSSWSRKDIALGFLTRLYLHQRKKGWK